MTIGPRSRRIGALLVGIALPGASLVAATPFTPAPAIVHSAADPCAASEVARTVGSTAKRLGDYLDSHPEANQVMTTVLQQPAGGQSLSFIKVYFAGNPKVAGELTAMSEPLATLANQCQLPISLPQALGLTQGALVPGGPAASLAAVGAPGAGGKSAAIPVAGPSH